MQNKYKQGNRDFGSNEMHFTTVSGPISDVVPLTYEQLERIKKAVEVGAQKFARETRELKATAMLMGEGSL